MSCPDHALPEGAACLPLPSGHEHSKADLASQGSVPSEAQRSEDISSIERWPDRPRALEKYRLPIEATKITWEGAAGWGEVREGVARLDAPAGTLVPLVYLEGQEGDAIVAFVGELLGATVITEHEVRVSGRLQRFLLVHGQLDGVSESLMAGVPISEGEPLGTTHETGMLLALRQLHEGVTLERVAPRRLLESSVSAPCDLRNALQLDR